MGSRIDVLMSSLTLFRHVSEELLKTNLGYKIRTELLELCYLIDEIFNSAEIQGFRPCLSTIDKLQKIFTKFKTF